jgi:hypothetical protein
MRVGGMPVDSLDSGNELDVDFFGLVAACASAVYAALDGQRLASAQSGDKVM